MPISITKALDIIYKNTPVITHEVLPIELTLGRIMLEDSIAIFDLPRFDNSAMDGYVVKCIDAGTTVTCNEVIYAGESPKMTLIHKTAIKIMTGAPIPNGCEAVIPIENVKVDGTQITLPSDIQLNGHIRRAGEDIKSGTLYLSKGKKVTAYSIALLASQGVTHLKVTRKIKVAVFGTGDELRPHFEKIQAHQLYNSNTPMFLARAKELGCEVSYIGSSGDTIASLETAIRSSLNADIIITSGGVSMGDRDFTKEAFINLGMTQYFEKIDIKPGKPTAFGSIGNTIIINLPGNPLAAMVNYEIFVRAAIRKMSGISAYRHSYIKTTLKENFSLRAGKYTVRLGTFDGKTFMPFKKQLPGMLNPMEKADAMIITTPNVTMLKKDAMVKMIPINWELGTEEIEDFFTQL